MNPITGETTYKTCDWMKYGEDAVPGPCRHGQLWEPKEHKETWYRRLMKGFHGQN